MAYRWGIQPTVARPECWALRSGAERNDSDLSDASVVMFQIERPSGVESTFNSLTLNIAGFGVVGNLVTVISIFAVVSRNTGWVLKIFGWLMDHIRLKFSIDLLLGAKALSDCLYCLIFIVWALTDYDQSAFARYYIFDGYDFSYFIRCGFEPIINTVSATSGWMMLAISLHRCYLVGLARGTYRFKPSRRCVKIAIAVMFVVSALLNAPQFWKWKVYKVNCYSSNNTQAIRAADLLPNSVSKKILIVPQPLLGSAFAEQVYAVVWTVFGAFLPMLGIIVSNIYLLRKIHVARRYFAQMLEEQQMGMTNDVDAQTPLRPCAGGRTNTTMVPGAYTQETPLGPPPSWDRGATRAADYWDEPQTDWPEQEPVDNDQAGEVVKCPIRGRVMLMLLLLVCFYVLFILPSDVVHMITVLPTLFGFAPLLSRDTLVKLVVAFNFTQLLHNGFCFLVILITLRVKYRLGD